MNKRIALPILIVLVLTMVILSYLGRSTLPTAPLTHAWRIPFGKDSYTSVVADLLPKGSEKSKVTALLGAPDSETVSILKDSRHSFIYVIPMSPPGDEMIVSFDGNAKVLTITRFE